MGPVTGSETIPTPGKCYVCSYVCALHSAQSIAQNRPDNFPIYPPARSLKVTGNRTVKETTYDFVLTSHSNCAFLIYCFIGIPRLHDTTGCQTGYTTGLTTGCIV